MTYDIRAYDEQWYASMEPHHEWKERCLFILLGIIGKPSSYLDIGCGDAHTVDIMGRITEDALGIDLESSNPIVLPHDLRNPLNLGRKYDLVVSTEVGEHLPVEVADIYLYSVVRHVGNWLVFSAAHPGQGGYNHINEQPKEYWREKIERFGLATSPLEEHISALWQLVVPPEYSWAWQNVMVFKKDR